MITIDDLADCMALPVALYPNFPFQKPQLLAYYELLKDLDSKEQLLSALKRTVKTSNFFPTVALIMEQAKGTPTPGKFDSTQIDNSAAVPMPERVKEMRDFIRFGAKSPDAPNSNSVSVDE